MAHPPIVTLLTDFGLSDHYVAAMKGVILGICPDARLVDISHEIPAFGIADAAFTLSQAWPYFPAGTVHLIVVDPGVGSARRPLLVDAAGYRFVAPDNGVLTELLRQGEAREIAEARFFRPGPSRTFHGRDIFAPVAAHLAAGVSPAEFGPVIHDPVVLPFAQAAPQILHVDRYGNLVTNLPLDRYGNLATETFELKAGACTVTQIRPNYAAAPPGELFLVPGSSGYWEISLNQASAAMATGLRAGDHVYLQSATRQR
jgi:S-adenosylmethionine hydrolase